MSTAQRVLIDLVVDTVLLPHVRCLDPKLMDARRERRVGPARAENQAPLQGVGRW
jgi:hypothetical protein